MIKIARLSNPHEKINIFKKFDPDQDLWVVSDLRSKLELQKEILHHRQGMPGDAILRGSELWMQLLKRVAPRSILVSREWLTLFARTALAGRLTATDLQICVDLIVVLAPVLSFPGRQELFAQMLQADPSAQTRWGKVLPEAQFLFDQAKSRGWVLQEALAPMLTEFNDLKLPRTRCIYFDLGASLTSPEAELIKRLSEHHEVVVLLPRPPAAEKFRFLLQPGESFLGEEFGDGNHPLSDKGGPQMSRRFLRFSGRVAEMKNAVGQVRVWLDQGIAIDKIAVLTPNFEMDFPVLAEMFRVEGVPLDRAPSERLQTHRQLQKWSAQLRLWKEELDTAELDYATLMTAFQEGLPLRSEAFEARLKTGMFHGDLARVPEVEIQARKWQRKFDPVPLSGFFKEVTSLWREDDFSDLEMLFEVMNERTPKGAQLSSRDWIEWMEVQMARLESSPARGSENCLAVVPLQSADSMEWSHRIFLSMVDSLPEKGGTALLTREEIDSLGWTHGFFLPHPEQKILQFELEWALTSMAPEGTDVLSYPLTDWSGAPTSPQALWLAGRAEQCQREGGSVLGHEADVPLTMRWDDLQAAQKSEHHEKDAGKNLEKPSVPVPQKLKLRLSSSSVQRFGDCPFIFAAEKVFALIDPPLVDVDLDRRQLGQLQHAYLERLTEPSPERMRFDYSESELGQILDDLAAKHQNESEQVTNPALWRAQKNKWISLGKRFLAVEQDWFQQYPGTRILAREKDFQFSYSPRTRVWRPGPAQAAEEVTFTGRVDRVDGLMKNGQLAGVVLYDYKASVQAKHGFQNWQKENEIQLGFYSWAIHEGLLDPAWKGRVWGAMYYDLKHLERRQGFALPEGSGIAFERALPKDISSERLAGYWLELQRTLETRIEQIQAGIFTATPRDFDLCKTCRWRGLCRAAHLA